MERAQSQIARPFAFQVEEFAKHLFDADDVFDLLDGTGRFPHPSPDGKWIAFLSYEPGVKGHPANQDVMLRLLPTAGGEIQVLAKLFGGQGTINVPSWAPDSTHLALVSYRLARP